MPADPTRVRDIFLAAIDRAAPADRAAGNKVVDPRLIPAVMETRLQHLAQAKDPAGCRATAEMWEKMGRTDAASLYNTAAARATTAAVLRGSGRPAATSEADRAMTWLRQAVGAGFKDAAGLGKDAAFDALHDRADLQKLLADLPAKK